MLFNSMELQKGKGVSTQTPIKFHGQKNKNQTSWKVYIFDAFWHSKSLVKKKKNPWLLSLYNKCHDYFRPGKQNPLSLTFPGHGYHVKSKSLFSSIWSNTTYKYQIKGIQTIHYIAKNYLQQVHFIAKNYLQQVQDRFSS